MVTSTRSDVRAALALATLFFLMFATPVLAQAVLATSADTPTDIDALSHSSAGTVSLVWAFFSSASLEWIKRNKHLTLFTTETTRVAQRVIGVVLSIFAAAGVHASFNSELGVLTVTGLVWATAWGALSDTLRQWVLQELVYRTAVKPYGMPVPAVVVPPGPLAPNAAGPVTKE
jgi:hypothetical protein